MRKNTGRLIVLKEDIRDLGNLRMIDETRIHGLRWGRKNKEKRRHTGPEKTRTNLVNHQHFILFTKNSSVLMLVYLNYCCGNIGDRSVRGYVATCPTISKR